jgi:uncharacterized Zn finger protein (UPF0148 family)
MSKKNDREAIERTGQLMLSGWKMLAISCPQCHAAILQSRSGEMLCPSCNLPIIEESKAPPFFETKSILNSIEDMNEASVLSTPNQPDLEDLSFEQLQSEYENIRMKRNQISELLGQKMLLGWTMVEDCCPNVDCSGVPLMREGGKTALTCVGCEKQYERNGNGLKEISTVSKPAESLFMKSSNISDNSEQPPIFNLHSFATKEDTSWKISEKLILGWSLLSETCTKIGCVGNVPLLQDGKNRVSLLI